MLVSPTQRNDSNGHPDREAPPAPSRPAQPFASPSEHGAADRHWSSVSVLERGIKARLTEGPETNTSTALTFPSNFTKNTNTPLVITTTATALRIRK